MKWTEAIYSLISWRLYPPRIQSWHHIGWIGMEPSTLYYKTPQIHKGISSIAELTRVMISVSSFSLFHWLPIRGVVLQIDEIIFTSFWSHDKSCQIPFNYFKHGFQPREPLSSCDGLQVHLRSFDKLQDMEQFDYSSIK